MQALVLHGHIKMAGAGRGQELYFFAHDRCFLNASAFSFQMRSPRARSLAMTASIPFFSTVRSPFADSRSEIQRFSPSSQKRCLCRLGRKRRRLRLFACDTVLPDTGRLPVT